MYYIDASPLRVQLVTVLLSNGKTVTLPSNLILLAHPPAAAAAGPAVLPHPPPCPQSFTPVLLQHKSSFVSTEWLLAALREKGHAVERRVLHAMAGVLSMGDQ